MNEWITILKLLWFLLMEPLATSAHLMFLTAWNLRFSPRFSLLFIQTYNKEKGCPPLLGNIYRLQLNVFGNGGGDHDNQRNEKTKYKKEDVVPATIKWPPARYTTKIILHYIQTRPNRNTGIYCQVILHTIYYPLSRYICLCPLIYFHNS